MRASKLTIDQLHEDTKLPKEWLTSFRLQRIGDPGVSRVQRLYEFLTGQSLVENK